MKLVFGQMYQNAAYFLPKCEDCIHCTQTGYGTRLIHGERKHFNMYGCDRAKECLEEEKRKDTE